MLQHLKWDQTPSYRQLESSPKLFFSASSSKPSHADLCHEMHLRAELMVPGRASHRHAARGTSHGDMTTWSCVPQLALIPLPLAAQPGCAEGHSRLLAGKEVSFTNATVAKSSHRAHKESASGVSSCAGREGFFWQNEVLNPCRNPSLHVCFWRVLCCFWSDADLPACRGGLEAAVGAERSHSALALPRIPWMFVPSKHRTMLLQPPSTTFAPSTGNCREYFLPP